jgi:hemerythrin superfamily protein
MDALDLLIGDHNRVRGLFSKFKDAKESDDLETMTTVTSKVLEELGVHTTIEEEIFYPAMQDVNDEIHDLITEGYEEHHVAKGIMGEIASMTPNTEDWAAKVTVLIENVEHHADEEEKEMFPKVRSATSAADRDMLGERLEARKAELGAPTTADTIDLTKEQLTELAQQQDIPGRSTMSREELAASVDPRSKVS